MHTDDPKSRMFEKEKKTLKTLFIFFSLSFLVESIVEIPFLIMQQKWLGASKSSGIFAIYAL